MVPIYLLFLPLKSLAIATPHGSPLFSLYVTYLLSIVLIHTWLRGLPYEGVIMSAEVPVLYRTFLHPRPLKRPNSGR